MLTVAIDIRRVNQFGFGTYLRNLVRTLGRLDGDNRYLLLGRPEQAAEMDAPGPQVELLPYPVPEASPRNLLQMPAVLRRARVDVLHVPHYHWIPPLLPCPHVVTIHDLVEFIAPVAGRSHLVSRSLFNPVRRSVRQAARVVAVSEATRQDVLRVFGPRPERVEVVYNAIDERFLAGHSSDAERQLVAARYAMHHPYILYAGNVQPHKNVEKLIEAFAVLKADLAQSGEFPELKLVVIGDELSKHPHLRRTVVRTRQEANVRFLGFVPIEILRVFYDGAKLFAFPSLYEGFGLPPLEAMAHGTPVVTSNLSSLPEVVDDAAVLVNPDNVFDIMRGLKQCLLDRPLRERLKERGYLQVKRFSWERSTRRMIEIFEEVGRKRPAVSKSS